MQDATAPAEADTFVCCETRIPWPVARQEIPCPECGTIWEHDGITIGGGARIKREAEQSPADPHRAAYIAGLRQLADALEKHPELQLPYEGNSDNGLTFHFLGGDDPRTAMSAAARLLPCSWRKDARDENYFDMFGQLAGLKVRMVAFRDQVCTRHVVGVEEQEVEETVTPAVTRTVRKPVEVVEWECHPVLADRPAGIARQAGAA